MNFNLPSITDKNETGAVCQLYNPSDRKFLDIKITTLGIRSRKFKTTNIELLQKIDGDDVKFKDEKYRCIVLLASLITDWEGLTLDDADYEFSEENAIQLLIKCPWVLSSHLKSLSKVHLIFFCRVNR